MMTVREEDGKAYKSGMGSLNRCSASDLLRTYLFTAMLITAYAYEHLLPPASKSFTWQSWLWVTGNTGANERHQPTLPAGGS